MKRQVLAFAIICFGACPVFADNPLCTPVDYPTFRELFIANLDGTGDKRWRAEVSLPTGKHGDFYWGRIIQQGQATGYCDCPDAHQDWLSIPYTHIHWNHTNDDLVITVNGQPFNITEDMSLAFWDDEYKQADGYQGNGGMDINQNCFGYAMGLGTWIEGPPYGYTKIVEDCWNGTSPSAGDATMVLFYAPHAIKIDAWQNCQVMHQLIKKLKTTSEKYRNSPVYTRDMGCNPAFTIKTQLGGAKDWPSGNDIPALSFGTTAFLKPKP